eukprot:TRINITY_DN4829_c0_g1_i3.p1 TRINITY_DN4829_c0_g1~~TRINITY_DN4829_c0_g1_i3.p1  ORF type:complete len:171 (+),score=28.95 TRINITY_DN4829_c0_g1_i3:151-663(+)
MLKEISAHEYQISVALLFNCIIPTYPHERVEFMYACYQKEKPELAEVVPRAKKVAIDCLRSIVVLLGSCDEIAVACFEIATKLTPNWKSSLSFLMNHDIDQKRVECCVKHMMTLYDMHRDWFEQKKKESKAAIPPPLPRTDPHEPQRPGLLPTPMTNASQKTLQGKDRPR